MPTIITASSGADFIALVPHLAGYRAVESVMLVAFRGRRTCGALRFDLPGETPLAQQRRIATAMVGTLCRIRGVDAVAPVVYTDAAFDGASTPPHAGFVDVLVHRAEVSGLLVRDALCRAADGWGSYLDPDLPPGGRDLAEVDGAAVTGLGELGESPVRESVLWGVDPPEIDPASRDRVTALLDGADPTPGRALDGRVPGDDGLAGIVEFLLAEDPELLTDETAAFAIAFLQPPAVRDLALLQWAFGIETGRRLEARTAEHAATGKGIRSDDAMLLAGVGPRPEAARIERATALLLALVARAPEAWGAPLLVQLAWLSWALGLGSRAAAFIERSGTVDGLAELIDTMLRGGRLPDWAFEVPEVDEAQVRYANA